MSEATPYITAANLKKMRKDAKMTQQELADALNEPRSTIANWETDGVGVRKKKTADNLTEFFNKRKAGTDNSESDTSLVNEDDQGYNNTAELIATLRIAVTSLRETIETQKELIRDKEKYIILLETQLRGTTKPQQKTG
jgi:transcriptional regulator with XRE-family HTH domain